MAATNETSHPDRNQGWYQEDLETINEPMRNLLEKYSKVSNGDIVKHVNNIVGHSLINFTPQKYRNQPRRSANAASR